jgi:hypothetical protein
LRYGAHPKRRQPRQPPPGQSVPMNDRSPLPRPRLEDPVIRRCFGRYAQSFYFQVARTAACNGVLFQPGWIENGDVPTPVLDQPCSCNVRAATVTPARRTASIMDRNSWVSAHCRPPSRRSSRPGPTAENRRSRSAMEEGHLAQRCSTSCRALQAAGSARPEIEGMDIADRPGVPGT